MCIIFLGIFIGSQFKFVETLTGGNNPSQKAKELKLEIADLRNKKGSLLKELDSLNDTIEEYENVTIKSDISIQKIKNDIDKYKLALGNSNVMGPGIRIRLDNSRLYENYEPLARYADYLLLIINKLNASGSEAICVNGQRIIATTTIDYIQDKNRLKINEKNMSPPFEIISIGDWNKLESTLNLKYGLIWSINKENIVIAKVKKEDNIIIPSYIGKLKFNYAHIVE